jgi:hypothetical protein
MVDDCRAMPAYRGQPILFNEDDHFDFDKPDNNMLAAVSRYASWGYFDFRMKGEGFDEGYQSVPVNWSISSSRKRGFFDLLPASRVRVQLVQINQKGLVSCTGDWLRLFSCWPPRFGPRPRHCPHSASVTTTAFGSPLRANRSCGWRTRRGS